MAEDGVNNDTVDLEGTGSVCPDQQRLPYSTKKGRSYQSKSTVWSFCQSDLISALFLDFSLCVMKSLPKQFCFLQISGLLFCRSGILRLSKFLPWSWKYDCPHIHPNFRCCPIRNSITSHHFCCKTQIIVDFISSFTKLASLPNP